MEHKELTEEIIGLILNFGEGKVEIKRKVRTLKSDEQDTKSCLSCSSCQNVFGCGFAALGNTKTHGLCQDTGKTGIQYFQPARITHL